MANPNYKIKTGSSIGAEKKLQLNYNEISKATKQLDVVPMPISNVADASTAAIKVGKGNICRVFGTTADFVAFGPSTIDVPDVNTQDASKMSAVVQMFVATDDYIRTSATVTRVEVIED
jgi:hypothetical protein